VTWLELRYRFLRDTLTVTQLLIKFPNLTKGTSSCSQNPYPEPMPRIHFHVILPYRAAFPKQCVLFIIFNQTCITSLASPTCGTRPANQIILTILCQQFSLFSCYCTKHSLRHSVPSHSQCMLSLQSKMSSFMPTQ
jgi:hypothetical protein